MSEVPLETQFMKQLKALREVVLEGGEGCGVLGIEGGGILAGVGVVGEEC